MNKVAALCVVGFLAVGCATGVDGATPANNWAVWEATPQAGQGCKHDADCSVGSVCIVMWNSPGLVNYSGLCADSCVANQDCQSGYCKSLGNVESACEPRP
jgi:hypothetical protein